MILFEALQKLPIWSSRSIRRHGPSHDNDLDVDLDDDDSDPDDLDHEADLDDEGASDTEVV